MLAFSATRPCKFELLLSLDAVHSVVEVVLHVGSNPLFIALKRDFVSLLTRKRVLLSRALSLWLAGVSASPVNVAMDAIDPWQTPVTSAVEAVEPCSRPLLLQHSWCVYATYW